MTSPMSSMMQKSICWGGETCISLKNCYFSNLKVALSKELEVLEACLKGNKLSMKVAKARSMTISTKPKQAALEGQS